MIFVSSFCLYSVHVPEIWQLATEASPLLQVPAPPLGTWVRTEHVPLPRASSMALPSPDSNGTPGQYNKNKNWRMRHHYNEHTNSIVILFDLLLLPQILLDLNSFSPFLIPSRYQFILPPSLSHVLLSVSIYSLSQFVIYLKSFPYTISPLFYLPPLPPSLLPR